VMSKAGVVAALTVGWVFILTTMSRLCPSNFHMHWLGRESDDLAPSFAHLLQQYQLSQFKFLTSHLYFVKLNLLKISCLHRVLHLCYVV